MLSSMEIRPLMIYFIIFISFLSLLWISFTIYIHRYIIVTLIQNQTCTIKKRQAKKNCLPFFSQFYISENNLTNKPVTLGIGLRSVLPESIEKLNALR